MIMTVSALSFAVALWFGGIEVINGNITLGDFVAFNSYLGMLTWPIAALGWITSMFQRGSVSIGRINVIMDEKPEIENSHDAVNLKDIKGKIEFKNLTFAYSENSKPVLKDINITIESGKTLAIVGRTGSGKTTLINLIQHLYKIPEGMLFVDGFDINKISIETVRSHIGYVPQDSFLFSTTLKENIDFFQGNSFESIASAAKTARVYDNIMDFPKQFETVIGERGITLSGGQKQRIAIARAILREPSILLLDDCLSAVDTHTEEEILKGLHEVMSQRTSIIVSHRILAVKDADEIIVLDDGEIIERGTHQSLLEMQGTYSDLYQKQLLAEQMEEAE
jgi:ATP-binding cassette subfamily B protein